MRRLKWRVFGLALTAALASVDVSAVAAQTASSAQIDALRSAASGGQVRSVYSARKFQPIWFSGQNATSSATQLIDLLATADFDGLSPKRYRPDRLQAAVEQARLGDPEDLARADVALSRAAIAYARDLRSGVGGDIAFVDKELRPVQPDAGAILDAAGVGASMDQVLQMHPLYIQLRSGYSDWRKRWANLPIVTIPAGPAFGSGAKGERVRLLRMRLGVAPGNSFDAKLVEQVQAFKDAHGLPATPLVDAHTITVLNEDRGVIDARIRLNLARARQLPAPASGRHVVVDAAGQRLLLYDGSRLADSMKVVVGKTSEQTPMMAAYIRYITINPYWNVPPDLAASRVAQGVLTDGLGYLQTKGYQVLSDWSATAQPLDPSTIDWRAVADGRVSLRVRQTPGPGNMMGTMKFMFPNKFGVYLHDTPEKVLFGEADRRRSSGCVRVEDAARLARWLYGGVPVAPLKSSEYNVALPRPVPLFITYLTVAPSQGGGLAFRDDVYGRDRLSSGMRLAGVY